MYKLTCTTVCGTVSALWGWIECFASFMGDGGAARRRGLGRCLLLRGSGPSGGGSVLGCLFDDRRPRTLEGGRPPRSALDSQFTIGICAGLEEL